MVRSEERRRAVHVRLSAYSKMQLSPIAFNVDYFFRIDFVNVDESLQPYLGQILKLDQGI